MSLHKSSVKNALELPMLSKVASETVGRIAVNPHLYSTNTIISTGTIPVGDLV